MAHNCENCKFHYVDYERDDELEDEVKIETCEKGHELPCENDFDCPDFKEYKPKPYVEKFTECDRCEHVKQCESDGYVINCTNRMDNFEHFIRGRNAYCRKERGLLFEDKKLSEIIEIVDNSNDPELKGGKKFLQEAIERFGDIAYREFIKEIAFEMFEN